MLESMFRSAFPHARSPKAARAHARSRKAFDYMAISGLLSNRIRDHPAMASQIRMPYVPGFHQTLPPLTPPGTAPPARHAGRPAVPRPPVGDRARHPQRPVQHAGRAAQAAHGLPQQLPPALVQRAMTVQLRAGQGRVGLVLTFQLPPTAGQDRSRTAGEASPAARPVFRATGGKRRCRSMRSSKAGDAARVARHRSGVQAQARAGCPRHPQGQGFMAATSWKRAGNRAVRMAREISTRPVSSGSRSDSSVRRLNSGNRLDFLSVCLN